ncbi:MAG: hypothetical protein M1131_00370 [Actinobacteria bacterium]|jgi:cadmium resistance protein CadD (predicted permease)|nr:hypothetical protein [Actinomycetota bacterium]
MAISTTVSDLEQEVSEVEGSALVITPAGEDNYVRVHVPFFKTTMLTLAVLVSIVVSLVVAVFVVSGIVDVVRSIATALR